MKLTNNKDGQVLPVLHGENFLLPVDAMPEGSTVKTKLYVAGHSESGHNHVLTSKRDMQVLETDTDRYILVESVAELFHQKTYDIHETITIEPGIYKITHKTEYDPFADVVRAVYD